MEDLFPERTSVAIGFFDSIHRGHQEVIKAAVREKKHGLTPLVFTFNKKSAEQMPYKTKQSLISEELKKEYLQNLGVEYYLNQNLIEIQNLKGKDFIKEILIERMNTKSITCGFNFTFGKDAKWKAQDLKRICGRYGIKVSIIPPICYKDRAVSSTFIRILLLQGKIRTVNLLLGRPFEYNKRIIQGRKIGRKIGVPTINQSFDKNELIPKFGVYASRVQIRSIGIDTLGVTNIGVKPTFGGLEPLMETWMPDYNMDYELYGMEAKISLKDYLREEKRFSSVAELKVAIEEDLQKSKSMKNIEKNIY